MSTEQIWLEDFAGLALIDVGVHAFVWVIDTDGTVTAYDALNGTARTSHNHADEIRLTGDALHVADTRPDRRGPQCRHRVNEGCYHCCERCNYDRHLCPGCSEPLMHEVDVCEPCRVAS